MFKKSDLSDLGFCGIEQSEVEKIFFTKETARKALVPLMEKLRLSADKLSKQAFGNYFYGGDAAFLSSRNLAAARNIARCMWMKGELFMCAHLAREAKYDDVSHLVERAKRAFDPKTFDADDWMRARLEHLGQRPMEAETRTRWTPNHCAFCTIEFADAVMFRKIERDVSLRAFYDDPNLLRVESFYCARRVQGALAYRNNGCLCNYCHTRIFVSRDAAEAL